mgnify:CR=1 FL=1
MAFFKGEDEKDGGAGQPGKSELIPLLPLREIVVFQHMVVPLFVGREKSVRSTSSERSARSCSWSACPTAP